MNIENCLIIALPLSMMLLGLYLFIKGIQDKPKATLSNETYDQDEHDDVHDKDGIPIIPRHLRQLTHHDTNNISDDQPNVPPHHNNQHQETTNNDSINAIDTDNAASFHHKTELTTQNKQPSDDDWLTTQVNNASEEIENETHIEPNFLNIDDDADDWLTVNHGTEQHRPYHQSSAYHEQTMRFSQHNAPFNTHFNDTHFNDTPNHTLSNASLNTSFNDEIHDEGVDIEFDDDALFDEVHINTDNNQSINSQSVDNQPITGDLYDVVYTSKTLDLDEHEQELPQTQQHRSDTQAHLASATLASATKKHQTNIQTASIPEFIEASPMLNEHLAQNNATEQDSPLTNASGNLNISILPVHEFGFFRGRTLLNLVDKFGFKFGTMNMFHRYQNKDGTGILWFSMMALTVNGVEPFDLNELPHTQLKGVVLFLSLPHPKILQGFDSMMSIANLLARELGGYVVDEHGEMMTKEYKISLRSQLQDIEELENP